jgi:hypothetical protein
MTSNIRPQSSGLAIASLVFSILSIVIGPFGFVPGIICGHIARTKSRTGSPPENDGLALAGLIVGYVFLVATVVIITAFFLMRTNPHAASFELQ